MTDERRPVLSVEEALEQILATVRVLEPERVPILEALGRVLAEEVAADRDIPPLPNSAMDGYAVRAADVAGVPARLRVIAEAPAGRLCPAEVAPGTAVRIMTGAPLPAGADAVVPFEHTRVVQDSSCPTVAQDSTCPTVAQDSSCTIEVLREVRPGANVREAGEDVRAGQVVLTPGRVLRPQEIGMLAALGWTEVAVVRRPRVAILATGDEVVPPWETPGPGQIRDANSYTVAAQVRKYGGIPLILGIVRDEETLVREGVRRALAERADLIVTSGGVSIGDFDLVKQVLAAEGEMRFWSLNMKPGRPLAFGVVGGVPLVGLPGNPVAAMIATELFVRPAVLKMQGFTDWPWPELRARLTAPITRKDGRRHYLRVRLRETDEGWEATLTGDQGSGILFSLVQADGLAVIPEDMDHLPAGSEVRVLRI